MPTSRASRTRQLPSMTGDERRTVGVVRSPKGVTCVERCLVADLLYAVLMIGIFVVLALALRGMEKL